MKFFIYDERILIWKKDRQNNLQGKHIPVNFIQYIGLKLIGVKCYYEI